MSPLPSQPSNRRGMHGAASIAAQTADRQAEQFTNGLFLAVNSGYCQKNALNFEEASEWHLLP